MAAKNYGAFPNSLIRDKGLGFRVPAFWIHQCRTALDAYDKLMEVFTEDTGLHCFRQNVAQRCSIRSLGP